MASLSLTSLVGECIEVRRQLLAKPDPRQGYGAADPGGDLTATGPDGGEICVTTEGPLGCTGRFTGAYDLDCSPASRDNGISTPTLDREGGVEVRFESSAHARRDSDPPPLRGLVDSAGRVVIERNEGQVFQRWEGTLQRRERAGDHYGVAGRGRYWLKVTGGGGEVYLDCIGTMVLGRPGES
jgi:hypothetical protein